MTLTEIISEAEAISRPSFLLREQPNDSGVVAYWGGSRADVPDTFPPDMAFSSQRHILTVSEELLARLGFERTGPVSLYEVERADDGNFVYQAEGDYRLRFSELSFSGTPLYATAASSFPPFPAVCYHGSEHVAAWLAEQKLARHDYWRASGEVIKQFEAEWKRRSPFCQSNADVVVGGWHFLWPEDHFYTPSEIRLLFLTLREAEPWFEVWHSPRSRAFTARERIT